MPILRIVRDTRKQLIGINLDLLVFSMPSLVEYHTPGFLEAFGVILLSFILANFDGFQQLSPRQMKI